MGIDLAEISPMAVSAVADMATIVTAVMKAVETIAAITIALKKMNVGLGHPPARLKRATLILGESGRSRGAENWPGKLALYPAR